MLFPLARNVREPLLPTSTTLLHGLRRVMVIDLYEHWHLPRQALEAVRYDNVPACSVDAHLPAFLALLYFGMCIIKSSVDGW